VKYFLGYFIFITCIGFCTTSLFAGEPDWIKKRPSSSIYYYGIGSAQKGSGKGYQDAAKAAALRDLSSEITVSISGEVIRTASERSGVFDEQVFSVAKTVTQADLEGFEFVDSFDGGNDYFIWYRLSREVYASKRADKIHQAVHMSSELVMHGDSALNSKNPAEALKSYIASFVPVERYITDPLPDPMKPSGPDLFTRIRNSIFLMINSISIKPIEPRITALFGRETKLPAEVRTEYRTASSKLIPLQHIPVRYSFTKGSGVVSPTILTDEEGKASTTSLKITGEDKVQVIHVELDLLSIASSDSSSPIVKNFLTSFTPQAADIVIDVKPLVCFVSSREQNFDNDLQRNVLETEFKNALGKNGGVMFGNNPVETDYRIVIMANTRKGSEMYGQFVAFLDGTVTVIESSSNKEIFSKNLSEIKGIGLDFEKAGLKAYDNAMKEISANIVQEILKAFQL